MPEFDGQETQAAPSQRVKVEINDFANAVAGDRYNCALVWAIRRKFPEAKRVSVNTDRVAYSVDETRFVYPSTEQIIEHVIKPLDQGGECKPVTVLLANGYTKPVKHYEGEKLEKHVTDNRRRTVKTKRGEHIPQSSSYKRLKIMNGETNG